MSIEKLNKLENLNLFQIIALEQIKEEKQLGASKILLNIIILGDLE